MLLKSARGLRDQSCIFMDMYDEYSLSHWPLPVLGRKRTVESETRLAECNRMGFEPGGTWYVKWRICLGRKSSTHPLIWECFSQNTHVNDQFFCKICQKGCQKWLSAQLYGKKSQKIHPCVGNFQSKIHPYYSPSIPVPKFMGVPSRGFEEPKYIQDWVNFSEISALISLSICPGVLTWYLDIHVR